MRRPCSIIITVLVVALVVVSTSLGYAYHRKSEKVSDAEWGLTQVADDDLFYMSNMGYHLSYLIKHNASNDYLFSTVRGYDFCAQSLSDTAMGLYKITGEDKYWYFSNAMSTLSEFLNTALNHLDRRPIAQKAGLLVNITKELNTLRFLENLTLEEAEKLNNMTNDLYK